MKENLLATLADRFIGKIGLFIKKHNSHLYHRLKRINPMEGHKENLASCNICGWQGEKFTNIDGGYGIVWDLICPSCNSHSRHRTFALYIEKIIARDKPIKLLHFAPERYIAKKLRKYKNIDYLSVDICREKAMKKEDIANLSFKDGFFDVIICIHVLEHVNNDKKAIAELYRVLNKNGLAIIDVPIDYNQEKTYENNRIKKPEQRARAFGQWDHLRRYGRDFPERLRKAGFKVYEDDFIYRLGDNKINYLGLRKIPIYVCKK